MTEASNPVISAPIKWYRDLIPEDSFISHLFTVETIIKLARIAISIALGLIFIGIVISFIKRFAKKRLDSRSGGLVIKIAQYLGFALVAINALEAANVDLSALLGAAGIAGIAIGFAAQTSVSNFISGFFLMSEKTFAEGDVISVDETMGIVYSVDTLSIKLRTFDNQLVRIPNETLIKSTVTNVTRFSVRRQNIKLTVPHNTDLDRVKKLFLETVGISEGILKKPDPAFVISGIAKDGIDLFMGVWIAKEDWIPASNAFYNNLIKRFRNEAISFAHSTMSISNIDNYQNPDILSEKNK